MATHSSTPAWRISGTEEPDGLPSMGSHRVGHNWSNLAAAAASMMAELWMVAVSKSPCLRITLSEWMTWSLLGVNGLKVWDALSYHWSLVYPKAVSFRFPVDSLARQSWLHKCLCAVKPDGDCFLMLGCFVLGVAHLWFHFLTTELMFFRHRMPHSVPVHPPWPHLDVLHHGCHAEHGQVQLLCQQVSNPISGRWCQKLWQL